MQKTDLLYTNYCAILREELLPAAGCTEPAAIAFASARAREELDGLPTHVDIAVSGNIIKNVRSVTVPNTGGLHGIKAAAAAGIVAGDSRKNLEVIGGLDAEQQAAIRRFMDATPMHVHMLDGERVLEIRITLRTDSASACVCVTDAHTHIEYIEKNGARVFQAAVSVTREETDRQCLSVKDILDFARTVELDDVRPLVERQIACNTAISQEGLRQNSGAGIGCVLLKETGDAPHIRARAAAAAGSDARMSGCEMPVIVISGSGNQGMAATLPVIEYARHLGTSHDTLVRALVLSSLVTIHLKTGIGRLSAYCGVVSAGAAAGAGIAYLHGGGFEEIAHTLINALAITSGIVCDGAKPSCAAKIAVAVDAGITGYFMHKNGKQFCQGEGLVSKNLEKTIDNISRLGREGMRPADKEIIAIMLNEENQESDG
ncbi:MAG: L-serine ammonia-lyase, iron-sulfur-dependent, subunit alpha [Spirochaetaceae bacterium]|jgi:L-cysteine desulfidase|nr:L-serine ammonia-lyase, iron-sulfur-dependent, subunit alpha [Spirochaetaceae bacterium]